jgi:hypothetical protein
MISAGHSELVEEGLREFVQSQVLAFDGLRLTAVKCSVLTRNFPKPTTYQIKPATYEMAL